MRREGLPLYTLAKNIATGQRELKSTTTQNANRFGKKLRDTGYAVSYIFSEADYKRAMNKAAVSGVATLSTKEIYIYDTYPEIVAGRWPTTTNRKESHACLKQLNPST